MIIRWTIPAIRTMAHIRAHISAEDQAAVGRILGRIDKAVSLLSSSPYLGRPGRSRGTRELKVQRTRHLTVYKIGRQEIDILAVFHERQDRPTFYSRASR